MSVILTAGKKPNQRKKKQSLQDAPAASSAAPYNPFTASSSRSSGEETASQRSAKSSVSAVSTNSYLPSESTVVWNHRLHGQAISIALSKDSLVVWCNDERMVVTRKTSSSSPNMHMLMFTIQGHQAQICIHTAHRHRPSSMGPLEVSKSFSPTDHENCKVTYQLTVDGEVIPQTVIA